MVTLPYIFTKNILSILQESTTGAKKQSDKDDDGDETEGAQKSEQVPLHNHCN